MAEHANLARAIIRFHFLTTLDENVAFANSLQAYHILARQLIKVPADSPEARKALLQSLYKSWAENHRSWRSGQPLVLHPGDYRLPADLDLSVWMEFRRKADLDEFFAVLSVKVLGFSVEDVAAALALSEGTVRHRLGRGLRHLGEMVERPGVQP